jgi:hypothetical protein
MISDSEICWKSQFGGADLQVIPLADKFKLWADECATLFGEWVQ